MCDVYDLILFACSGGSSSLVGPQLLGLLRVLACMLLLRVCCCNQVILLGDSAVGKSKLVERFLMDDYHPRQVANWQ